MRLHEIAIPVIAMALLVLVVMTQYGRAVGNIKTPQTTSPFPVGTPVYGSLCGPENQNCKSLTFDTGFKASDFADP